MNNANTTQVLPHPSIIYGTAWKEERTANLTQVALQAGFRAIDTANQRKHYNEAGVGQAIAAQGLPREALFLQTKFTYVRGQDHRLPYDPKVNVAIQVKQSFGSSLEHLATQYIDSYLLHGPEFPEGWSENDRQAWGAMEELQSENRVRHIGVSNVSLQQLEILCGEARVLPTFVQNRCYARNGWDQAIRTCCRQHGIVYQGFSLLTANTRELAQTAITTLAGRLGLTVPQLVFRFASGVKMIALTGTSDENHMRQDLDALQGELSAKDIQTIESVGR